MSENHAKNAHGHPATEAADAHAKSASRHETSEGAAKVRDPVCGRSVDPATTPHHARHEGRTYHFCSAGCRAKFEARPELFLDEAPRAVREGGTTLHLP